MKKSDRKKKKSRCSQLQKIIKPNLDSKTAPICDGDVCSLKLKPSPSSSSAPSSTTQGLYTKFQVEKTRYTNSTTCSLSPSEENSLSALLPPDFYSGLKLALKEGFLLSFLSTLTEDVVTDLLKPRGYKDDHIYWINQTIKALILIAGGMALGKTLAAPFINLLLIKGLGVPKDIANYTTLTSVVAFDLWTNPLTAAKMLTVGAVATMSMATSLATHFCYGKSRTALKESHRITKEPENLSIKHFGK